MTEDEIELLMAKAVIPVEFPRPFVRFDEFPAVVLDACNKANVDFKVAKRGDGTFWLHCHNKRDFDKTIRP